MKILKISPEVVSSNQRIKTAGRKQFEQHWIYLDYHKLILSTVLRLGFNIRPDCIYAYCNIWDYLTYGQFRTDMVSDIQPLSKDCTVQSVRHCMNAWCGKMYRPGSAKVTLFQVKFHKHQTRFTYEFNAFKLSHWAALEALEGENYGQIKKNLRLKFNLYEQNHIFFWRFIDRVSVDCLKDFGIFYPTSIQVLENYTGELIINRKISNLCLHTA